MKQSPRLSRAGFTLLEIMLVVAIIALILGGAVKVLGPQLSAAKVRKAEADLAGFKTALMTYQSFAGTLPSSQQGLKALVSKPATEPKPVRWVPQMDDVPKDPWGHDYVYECPGKHNPSSYDLSSPGADGQAGTDDDVGNWQ